MQISTLSYLDKEGNLSPSCKELIPQDQLLKIYKEMVKTRLVDERMITLQRQGLISFALSSYGEEACSVASVAALDSNDWLYPQYREVGVMFYRGFSILEYMQHMFSNAEDLILGRQMPNHFGSRKLNVVTVSSPIATQIPHAAGCAYAMKLQKESQVAVAYFGEGATSEGDFHVGLNFAAVRKAPAIFFCRNNGYAISTPCERQFASDGIAPKGIGYGMTTFRIDGNDVFAIYEAVRQARLHCLEGKGPVLIEAMTYRLGAHSTSDDPTQYRTEEEVQERLKQCPILRFFSYLQKRNLWSDKENVELIASYSNEISSAIAKAKATAKPPLRSLVEHVYFEVPQALNEQYETIKSFFPDR